MRLDLGCRRTTRGGCDLARCIVKPCGAAPARAAGYMARICSVRCATRLQAARLTALAWACAIHVGSKVAGGGASGTPTAFSAATSTFASSERGGALSASGSALEGQVLALGRGCSAAAGEVLPFDAWCTALWQMHNWLLWCLQACCWRCRMTCTAPTSCLPPSPDHARSA